MTHDLPIDDTPGRSPTSVDAGERHRRLDYGRDTVNDEKPTDDHDGTGHKETSTIWWVFYQGHTFRVTSPYIEGGDPDDTVYFYDRAPGDGETVDDVEIVACFPPGAIVIDSARGCHVG